MLHIFTIHSHITFLSAMAVISHNGLNSAEVVLICGSNYVPRVKPVFSGKIVESFDTQFSKKSRFFRWKNFNYSKAVEKYIHQITGGDAFTAYIDLMSVFNRYLVMNRACKQFHIIEEGIVNYADYNDFHLLTADLRNFQWKWTLNDWKEIINSILRLIRGRSLRILALPIHPNIYTSFKNTNAYCFSELAFKECDPKNKVIMQFIDASVYIDFPDEPLPKNSWVWIGDGLCQAYRVSMDDFQAAFLKLMEEINPLKEKREIFLKFRGVESEQEKQITLDILARYNFLVTHLKPNVIMELLFARSKNLNVCGIASSLLIYAAVMQHNTYSIFKYIPNIYDVSLINGYEEISKKVGFVQ